jgi:hypothetical protein
VNYIAKRSSGTWSALGSGVDNAVYALAVNGPDVYAGGYFDQLCGNVTCNSGNITVNRVAKWNGAWSGLGNGVYGTVYALAANGPDLYVGGDFYRLWPTDSAIMSTRSL